MSASPPRADMLSIGTDVRYVQLADTFIRGLGLISEALPPVCLPFVDPGLSDSIWCVTERP